MLLPGVYGFERESVPKQGREGRARDRGPSNFGPSEHGFGPRKLSGGSCYSQQRPGYAAMRLLRDPRYWLRVRCCAVAMHCPPVLFLAYAASPLLHDVRYWPSICWYAFAARCPVLT
eukprot:3485296-Rhodomonas_salina.3